MASKTSAIVGVEKYSQVVTLEGVPPLTPRRLVAEFAIVRAGAGWTGFRDVVEVDGKKVEERKDRLERLLTEMTGSESDLMRIASENARFNVGPISRNLNVPTAALFFLQPANLPRFTFTRKGTKKIEGVETVELEFKETQRPTIVRRRNGADVPMEGAVWVVPSDGTVVRTRLRLKNFADAMAMPGQQAPGSPSSGQPQCANRRQASTSRAIGDTCRPRSRNQRRHRSDVQEGGGDGPLAAGGDERTVPGADLRPEGADGGTRVNQGDLLGFQEVRHGCRHQEIGWRNHAARIP